ncbi:DNRLRE domain-containing protein [Corallococcus sp. RDP092CA]|uniref:CBM96 family carbohydrate-binding protein n=1 Tax=Corallococcus sp. RDP092CA TaxID=3109369 RepID=UPI0035B45DF6
MHLVSPWKQSPRSLLITPLIAGLVPGCDGGEARREPAPSTHVRPAPLLTTPTPKQIILEPEANTYVRAANPSTNFGTAQNLYVDSSKAETYLRFNLSGIPAGAHIASVMLQALAYDGSSPGGDGSVYAHLVPDDTWSETGMTWNNRPAVTGDRLGSWWLWNPSSTPKPLQLGVNFDARLKAPVQQALDSDGRISFRLRSPGYHTVYRSREYSVASERPRLVVSYFEPTDPRVTAHLEAASFSPVADASVWMSTSNANAGSSMALTVDRADAETFLRFDLSALPPTIQVASVVLVTTSSGGDATPGADTHVYTRWVPNNAWSETGLTWNTKPSVFSCELGSWQFPSQPVPYTTQAGVNASPLLVPIIQEALSMEGQVSLRLDSPGSRSVYDSREYSNTTARLPRLIVYYTLPTVTP